MGGGGGARVQTKALSYSVSSLVAMMRAKEGGQVVHDLVSEQKASLLPDYLIRDGRLEPTTLAGGLASQFGFRSCKVVCCVNISYC